MNPVSSLHAIKLTYSLSPHRKKSKNKLKSNDETKTKLQLLKIYQRPSKF